MRSAGDWLASLQQANGSLGISEASARTGVGHSVRPAGVESAGGIRSASASSRSTGCCTRRARSSPEITALDPCTATIRRSSAGPGRAVRTRGSNRRRWPSWRFGERDWATTPGFRKAFASFATAPSSPAAGTAGTSRPTAEPSVPIPRPPGWLSWPWPTPGRASDLAKRATRYLLGNVAGREGRGFAGLGPAGAACLGPIARRGRSMVGGLLREPCRTSGHGAEAGVCCCWPRGKRHWSSSMQIDDEINAPVAGEQRSRKIKRRRFLFGAGVLAAGGLGAKTHLRLRRTVPAVGGLHRQG